MSVINLHSIAVIQLHELHLYTISVTNRLNSSMVCVIQNFSLFCRQLLVRHHSVYYAVRMDLVQHMISSMQRLGFTQSATIEHRKLAVDLAEVIIEWEKRRYLLFDFVFLCISYVKGFRCRLK